MFIIQINNFGPKIHKNREELFKFGLVQKSQLQPITCIYTYMFIYADMMHYLAIEI